MNPEVDWFFNKATKWQEAYSALRELMLESGLTEEVKWGCPCYTGQGNVALIHGFKDYCALLFMQGALLNDPNKLLVQQTNNVQSARQLRFTGIKEVLENRDLIKAYIREAIENDKAGLKVALKETSEYLMPVEFQQVLDEMGDVKAAFESLTPGRQRAYLLYFSAAKQAKTREARIEKCLPKLLDGRGLSD